MNSNTLKNSIGEVYSCEMKENFFTVLFTNEMNGRSYIAIMRGVYDENKIINSSERVIPVDINQNVEKFADMKLGDAKDELPSSSGSFITCASFKGSDEQREVLIQ